MLDRGAEQKGNIRPNRIAVLAGCGRRRRSKSTTTTTTTTATTMMVEAERPVERSAERPAAAQRWLNNQVAFVSTFRVDDDGDAATKNETATTDNQTIIVVEQLDNTNNDNSESKLLCRALLATALQRPKESQEIQDCFTDPNRQLLLVEGPCGGT
jgi:hypothetical protein